MIRKCNLFPGATRSACYFWLGKALSVVTNGRFRNTGCPALTQTARAARVAGARSMNTPLVTFS